MLASRRKLLQVQFFELFREYLCKGILAKGALKFAYESWPVSSCCLLCRRTLRCSCTLYAYSERGEMGCRSLVRRRPPPRSWYCRRTLTCSCTVYAYSERGELGRRSLVRRRRPPPQPKLQSQ